MNISRLIFIPLFFLITTALCVPMAAALDYDNMPGIEELPSQAELPDPLVMFDGSAVETPEQWFTQRRPELKTLFSYYMYGIAPEPPEIDTQITQTVPDLLQGKATLKEVTIRFPALADDAPAIHLALFVPNEGDGPYPVFMGLNKCGNHTVLGDERITVDPDVWRHSSCSDEDRGGRGAQTDFWEVEYLIDRGYAFATFHESNIDPDRHDFTDGIHPYFEDLPGPEGSHWGTIAAWAWGLQRCVDYLQMDEDIDNDRIAITGHSRRGKTALLASAFDERVDLAVPHQSGTGGAALSRENDQETVERINRVFPHWFNDHFTWFNDREAKLPFDQHLLMALMAPRPLLDTAGLQDTWANYESALRGLQAADEVYEFLGYEGLSGDGMVMGDNPIEGDSFGELMQYRRDTPHTLNRGYWETMLDFADAHFSGGDAPMRVSAEYPTVGHVERYQDGIDQLVPQDAKLELLAEGFDWSEGPCWIPQGDFLIFSDVPRNTIYRWQDGDGLRVYLQPSGYTQDEERGGETGSNGLLLDAEGRLVLCQHGDRRMARMNAPVTNPEPDFTTLAGEYAGKKFNSPNDAAFHKNGDLYFTDPPYGLEFRMEDPKKEIDFQGVYQVTPEGEVTLLTDELSRPNGIAFSPDYQTLYVANSDGSHPVWMAYPVLEDGTLGEGQVFFLGEDLPNDRRGGGDGLKVDQQGNVFATGPGGVLVISPEGEHLGTIVTGKATSNCAFGDDGSTLYITADNYLLRIDLSTTGMGF